MRKLLLVLVLALALPPIADARTHHHHRRHHHLHHRVHHASPVLCSYGCLPEPPVGREPPVVVSAAADPYVPPPGCVVLADDIVECPAVALPDSGLTADQEGALLEQQARESGAPPTAQEESESVEPE